MVEAEATGKKFGLFFHSHFFSFCQIPNNFLKKYKNTGIRLALYKNVIQRWGDWLGLLTFSLLPKEKLQTQKELSRPDTVGVTEVANDYWNFYIILITSTTIDWYLDFWEA